MKLKLWILAMLLVLAAVAQGATNELTGLLQQGLFDEEANRNLDAAIADYQTLANAFDKDRQTAATAIFRLGECYRKLGKTNEAVLQYQRIIKEFGDQPTLVTLSQQNLAGLAAAESASTGNASSDVLERLKKLRASENNQSLSTGNNPSTETARELQLVKKLQGMSLDEVRQTAPTVLTDATLINLIYQFNQSELTVTRLLTDHGPEHSEVKKEQAMQEALGKKIQERLDGLAQALSLELEVSGAAPRESVVANGPSGGTTDEEEKQIRIIQAMIQNSPDLINAPSGEGGQTPLVAAARRGQLVVAKYLLDHGADVNELSSNHGLPPLCAAAQSGHKTMVELLLACGADVTGGGLNPLYLAVSSGFTGVAEVLLANKADVNLHTGTDTSGKRPLHAAVQGGKTDLIQLLINHGADVNVGDAEGNTPLEFAAGLNESAAAKLLLAAKAAVEAKDKRGNTPLHEAARRGYTEMVSLLLDSGASVDATNVDDATPLLLAIQNGNKNIDSARVLLQHKANPNFVSLTRNSNGSVDKFQPVYAALDGGKNDILKLLLESGASPEGDASMDSSPLLYAIGDNNVGAVQLLLEHGANPNRPDQNRNPPLSLVLKMRKDKQMVPLLLDKGADANAKDQYGRPPLVIWEDPEIGRWLVEHKADIDRGLGDRWTPLILSASNGSTNFLSFLLEAGAKIDLQETNGNTALHFAVYNSKPESVAILIKRQANPNIQNNHGFTPLDLAKKGEEAGQIPGEMFIQNWMQKLTPPDLQKNIAEQLAQAGGLVNLPKLDRIEVRRASNSIIALSKDSRNRNRFSLLETIASTYGILTEQTQGEWQTVPIRDKLLEVNRRFPDLKRVVIYRRTDKSAKQTAIEVDVEAILNSGDCSRDQWLEWGDVVEIPEADHPLDQGWAWFSQPTTVALIKCLSRQATLKIKGESTILNLSPALGAWSKSEVISVVKASFMLGSMLDNSKLVRVSSDLSRVKVTRYDPATKKNLEWIVDCTIAGGSDLWLRDGDVIEVPEKQ